jgi:DNA-binding FrmR family transcriptional regulator
MLGTGVPNRSSASLILDISTVFSCDSMKIRKVLIGLVVALFLLPVIPYVAAVAPPTTPTVVTDQPYYHPGDVVEVTGAATVAGQVTLRFKVGSEIISTITVTAADDGSFQYSYNLPADPDRGTWTVEAEDSAISTHKVATNTFIVLNAATQEIAEKLLEIATGTKSYTEGKLGTQPPEAAQENFDAGVKALEDAQALWDSGKYAASIEASLRAQKHFGNALKILAMEHPQEEHEDDEDKLEDQIERTQKMLNSLKAIYNKIEKNLSTEVSNSINEELTAAQTDLDEAKTALAADELTETGDFLSDAKNHIETAKGLLHDYFEEEREDKIFIDKAIERVDKLKETIETLKESIGAQAADELIAKLNTIRAKLVTLKDSVEGGATVEEINNQMKAIQEALDDVHDDILRGALKEMDRLRAWIQIMKDTRGMMLRKGFKIDDVDAKIKQGEESLGSMISDLAAGRKMNGKFSEIVHGFQEVCRHRGDW